MALTYFFPNFESVCHSMFSYSCCFLTCIQVSHKVGKVIWFSHLLKNFSQFYCDPRSQRLSYSQWNRSRFFFLEFFCFFYNPMDVENLISGYFAFSKRSLNIWKFSVHVLLKPGLENFEHYFTSVWDECNCVVVGAFFGIAFLRDWNENCPFPVLWLLLSIPHLLAYWVQCFHSIIF